MSLYAWVAVTVLSAASILGIIVFLLQFRKRRSSAMIALIVAIFTTLLLCASTMFGGSFVVSGFGH